MDFNTYYLQVIRYLTIRPRSEKEIREYLKKKIHGPYARSTSGTEEENSLIEAIIQKIKEQKFINDEEFTRMWIRNRTECKPKGERLIRLELQQKGISKEIMDKVFRSFAIDAEGSGGLTRGELALAKEILEKKRKKFEPMEKQEQFNKAGSLLARKGFDLGTIKKAIEEVFRK